MNLTVSIEKVISSHNERSPYIGFSATLNCTIVWDVTPCSLVEVYRQFRGKYCLSLYCRAVSNQQMAARWRSVHVATDLLSMCWASPVARHLDAIFLAPQAQYAANGLRLLAYILDILSSNLNSDTGHPDWGISSLPSLVNTEILPQSRLQSLLKVCDYGKLVQLLRSWIFVKIVVL
jgi:hypothetical protein